MGDPTNMRTPLTDTQIKELEAANPDLPSDYLQYVRTVGWGEAASGWMVYSGPVAPDEIYGDGYEGPEVYLLGDDFQGYAVGYDPAAGRYGQVNDQGEWEPASPEIGLNYYVLSEEPDEG